MLLGAGDTSSIRDGFALWGCGHHVECCAMVTDVILECRNGQGSGFAYGINYEA